MTTLPESDISEKMAVLQRQGIDSAKEPGTEGTWTMTVPSGSFAEAVRVIKVMGYPRPKSPEDQPGRAPRLGRPAGAR